MITISCTLLEQVRVSPTAHGKIIATTDKPKSGGQHGMFAYWQDVVKLVHTGDLTISEGIKELQNKFNRFDSNLRNSNKQSKLIEQFAKYCASYDKQKFEFIDSKHQMKWDIVNGVRLTGLTPWVVHNKDGYFSYIITEQPFDWQSQLRFPLIQQYLIDNHIECDSNEMQVGIYCLETNSFEFKNYSKREIQTWVSKTGEIFQTVLDEYQKWKK